MTEIALLKWRSAVSECRIHEARLRAAMSRVAIRMPVDADTLSSMNDETAAWMDQFLYRFLKLQDAMGERVLSDGLLLMGEDYRDKPFIDALNRLEALNLIPSRDWWQELRETRNQIAHEYPERRAEQAAAVNAIYEQCPSLLDTFGGFVSTVESRLPSANDNPGA
jgi:hypothetical protein